MPLPGYKYVPVLSCNDWWIVFDSEVPCFWLLNERGISLALLDPCGMIQTKRAIKSHHSSLVHRLISGRHTAVGDFADFQGASDEHT
jgi:hypothetical protein